MWRAIRKSLVRILVVPLAALFFLVEEYIWVHLEALGAWIARFRVTAWLEARIVRLKPYPAMALFLVPLSLAWGVKLFGLYLLGTGQYVTAVAVVFAGKIVGTAFAARLFHITKPALLTLGWFARCYAWVMRAKDWAYTRVRALPAYIAAKRAARHVRVAMWRMRRSARRLFGRRGERGAFARYYRVTRARWRRRTS